MTEQTIINGVDVSGCLYYKDKQCIITHFVSGNRTLEDKCKLAPNCYYKQLQRKTAECEKLKNELKIATEALDTILDYIKETNNGLGSLNIVRLTIVRKIIDTQQSLEQIGAEDDNNGRKF